jgi:hypothetical protein
VVLDAGNEEAVAMFLNTERLPQSQMFKSVLWGGSEPADSKREKIGSSRWNGKTYMSFA